MVLMKEVIIMNFSESRHLYAARITKLQIGQASRAFRRILKGVLDMQQYLVESIQCAVDMCKEAAGLTLTVTELLGEGSDVWKRVNI